MVKEFIKVYFKKIKEMVKDSFIGTTDNHISVNGLIIKNTVKENGRII
jgi:predicted neutral ceramidase superfamily lipid hydrolase